MPFLFLILNLLFLSLKLNAIKFSHRVLNFIKAFLTKSPRNIWGVPNLSYSMCPTFNRCPILGWVTAWNIIFITIFQKYFPYWNKQRLQWLLSAFLPSLHTSQSPGSGKETFLSARCLFPLARLWILKRRILFHTLPNLLCLPRLSPYLLFLPLLDDYFLSSSLFFFPLVLSCLCCSGFTIWFCSPYRSPSLCHNPRLPHPCFSSPFHSTPFLSYFPQGFQREAQPGPAFPFLPAANWAVHEFPLLVTALQLSSSPFNETGTAPGKSQPENYPGGWKSQFPLGFYFI